MTYVMGQAVKQKSSHENLALRLDGHLQHGRQRNPLGSPALSGDDDDLPVLYRDAAHGAHKTLGSSPVRRFDDQTRIDGGR